MKRTSIVVLFALFGTFATTANAGWHHRHAYPVYQAVPVMVVGQGQAFQMQIPSPEFQLQFSEAQMQALAGQIVTAQAAQQLAAAPKPAAAPQAMQNRVKILEDLIGDLKDGLLEPETDNSGSGDVERDLATLKRNLTSRLAKIDSTLEIHEEHIIAINNQLKSLKSNANETKALRKAVDEFKKKLSGKTPPAVTKVLDSEGFKTTLQGMLNDKVKVEDALKSLKDKIEDSLD